MKGENEYYNNSREAMFLFFTPLLKMKRSSWQKMNNETLDLSHTLDQMDPTDIYRTFHPTATEYICFSSTHDTLQNGSYAR